MKPPPGDWAHLGDCLQADRNGRPVNEIARASGVSASSIEMYESGRAWKTPPPKLWQLVNFYRWTPDSLRAVLAGGLPRYLPVVTPRQAATMMVRIRANPDLSPATREILCAEIAKMVTADNGTNGITAPTP